MPRLIADQPLLWTPTDTPKLTADELRDLLREYKRLDAPELKEKLGQPNALRKYVHYDAYEHYYELTDRNGRPCYAEIQTDAPYGEIWNAFLCSPYITYYDYTLWDGKDGD